MASEKNGGRNDFFSQKPVRFLKQVIKRPGVPATLVFGAVAITSQSIRDSAVAALPFLNNTNPPGGGGGGETGDTLPEDATGLSDVETLFVASVAAAATYLLWRAVLGARGHQPAYA